MLAFFLQMVAFDLKKIMLQEEITNAVELRENVPLSKF